jgi:hypothetical protein
MGHLAEFGIVASRGIQKVEELAAVVADQNDGRIPTSARNALRTLAAELAALDPAPRVLLDRSAAENALEIVVAFSTAEDETAAVKSDLIKAVHAALYTEHGKAGNRLSVGTAG